MKTNRDYILTLITHLRSEGPVILLESQMDGHRASTKSFLAARPVAWIKTNGRTITQSVNGRITTFRDNPWEAFRRFYNDHEDWLFGFFGYDLKNHLEDLSSSNNSLIEAPDMFFFVPDVLVELDKELNMKTVKGGLPGIKAKTYKPAVFDVIEKRGIDQESYQQTIVHAQTDIYEGQYYEINLSHPLRFQFSGDALDLYEKMRNSGPVPFGAYMSLEETEVCCSSPERFLARSGNKVWSQPIKGTAPRTQNDESLRKLKGSEKERAENLMIVDLVRNDLNKMAEKGTVRVTDLFEIQSFETVHQMVSTIECTVHEKTDNVDLIKACFPMGSMTGAPKIAAMKAIENYEQYKRGIYSGALGYFSPAGDFDLNVVIRTAIIQQNDLIYPVGGAITSDSDPEAEWEETLLKAKAITNIFH